MADAPLDAAALPVWTYDPVFAHVNDAEGHLVVSVISDRADEVGPLLAAAPLVPALVAALRNGRCIDCRYAYGSALGPACDTCHSTRALLAHPALTRLGEHT